MKNIFSKILPIYWAFLTYTLLFPKTGKQSSYWFMFDGIDKVVHFLAFALLGFFFRVTFPKTTFLTFIQIMLCYAFLTEILQDEMQMGRSLDSLDVVADILGSLLGYFVYYKIKNLYQNISAHYRGR